MHHDRMTEDARSGGVRRWTRAKAQDREEARREERRADRRGALPGVPLEARCYRYEVSGPAMSVSFPTKRNEWNVARPGQAKRNHVSGAVCAAACRDQSARSISLEFRDVRANGSLVIAALLVTQLDSESPGVRDLIGFRISLTCSIDLCAFDLEASRSSGDPCFRED